MDHLDKETGGGDADFAAALNHPAIIEAALALSRGIIEVHRGNRLLNLLGNDRGRFVMIHMIFYLAARGELTTNRFKAVCVQMGACSAGRAAAMLSLLRYVGFVTAAEPARPGQPQRLVPTEGFTTSQLERWRNLFAAAALISPLGAEGLARADDPAFFDRYAAAMGQWALDGRRAIDNAPALEPLVEKTGGMMLLLMIFVAADGVAGRPAALAVGPAAHKLGVSRAHIARVLREATDLGFVTRSGPDADLAMTPALLETVIRLQGGNLGIAIGRIREALEPSTP